jgi:hypothetical protein
VTVLRLQHAVVDQSHPGARFRITRLKVDGQRQHGGRIEDGGRGRQRIGVAQFGVVDLGERRLGDFPTHLRQQAAFNTRKVFSAISPSDTCLADFLPGTTILGLSTMPSSLTRA